MNNQSKGRVGIIETVKTPLGFFTLIVLVSELILGGLATRANGTNFTILLIGMLLVLFALIGAVVMVEVKGRSAPPDARKSELSRSPEQGHAQTAVVAHQALEQQIKSIGENVQLAARRNSTILTDEISHELNTLSIESRAWSRGELQSSVQRYNSVLLTLYDHANESIFSTTIRDYLSDWPEELMEKMITAGEKSRARSVTRVFVFAERTEIDETAIKILRRFQESSRVLSLVYIDGEDQGFNFPPDTSRDFVVIDKGEAIGVTVSYGLGNLRAQWYFGDPERKLRFKKMCDDLERGSIKVSDVLKWWDNLPAGETTNESQP